MYFREIIEWVQRIVILSSMGNLQAQFDCYGLRKCDYVVLSFL